MKKIYAFILGMFMLLATNFYGQTSLEPNPSINNDFAFTDFEVVGYTTVTNNSDEFVSYTWTREIVQMTEGWACAICDINLCYLNTVSTQSFGLNAGEEGNLDVHIYPGGIEGSAIIELNVVDNEDPTNMVTGVYYFNQALGVAERLSERIKIFPNPVTDVLNIESGKDVQRIDVFNIEGKLVYSELLNSNTSINLSSLSTGTFILRMFDGANNHLSGNVLIKQ